MRRLVLLLPVALAVAALAALAPGSPIAGSCAGAGSNRAALVAEHGDGSVVTRCVSFDAATLTGEGLLNASGVAWSGQSYGGFGAAVCALDAEPAHYSTCPGKDDYWAVFISRGSGAWQLASIGISSLALGDGDALGFRYVPAVGTPAPPPSPAGVCTTAAPTPTRYAGSGTVTTPPGPATPLVSAAPSFGSTDEVAAATQATAIAPAGPSAQVAAASAAATSPPGSPGPAPSGGADLGLLLAAVAGGGLAGLAVLRLVAARRRPS